MEYPDTQVNSKMAYSELPTQNSELSLSPNTVKVVYLIWSLGMGGAEQVVIRLAAGLDRNRFTPLIICMNEPGECANQAAGEGIEVIALHKSGPVDIGMLLRLIRLLRERQIDILHAHLWGAGFWGRIAALRAGVPVVLMHEHGMQSWRGWFHFMCDRYLARSTNKILFASEKVMQQYQARTGVSANQCRVITNGVLVNASHSNREAFRSRQGWLPHDRVILCVGRLSPEKGHADLMKAFAKVRAAAPATRLVVIGDGPQHEQLQRMQSEADLNGKVMLAGKQDNVAEWLHAADIYVQPSHREGLPLAVLEAMAAELPVVVTKVGDLPQLITHGKDGFLVEANNPDALAGQLLDLLALSEDHLYKVAKAGKQLIGQRYSYKQMLKSVEQVYEEELSRSQVTSFKSQVE